MSYTAYFKGGPLHGTTRVIPSPNYELYFPMMVQQTWKDDVDLYPSYDMHTAVYEMKRKLGADAFEYEFHSIVCPNEGNDMTTEATFTKDELEILYAALGKTIEAQLPGSYALYERVETLIEKDPAAAGPNSCTRKGN